VPSRFWSLLAALAVLTAALCAVSIGFLRFNGIEAAVWPANAIVLAFVLRGFHSRREKAIGLAVAMAVRVGTNLALGRPLSISLVFPLANALEIVVAAWAMRQVRMPMSEVGDYLRFLTGAVVLGPFLSALVAAGGVIAVGMVPLSEGLDFVRGWFLSGALGMAVTAPFALTVASGGFKLPEGRQLGRGALAQLLVLVIPVAACLPWPSPIPFSVFIFPAVAIAVFVSRDTGGLLAIATVSTVLVTGAVFGTGPAGRAEQIGADGLLMVQCLLASLVATVHPLSAVLRRLDAYAAAAEARRERAESVSESKTRFLSVMSEELRSPLTGVLTVAELVKSGRIGNLTPKQRELMGHLVESGEQIDALTRRLIDAAALQSGSREAPGESFNLTGMLVSAVTAARFQSRRDCDIRLGVAEETLEVQGDPHRLRHSLIRLIIDATRYSGKPGLVQVSAFDTGQSRIRIQIEDDGEGVPIERMMELNSASAETSGLGVGLGLTRDLMRLQGGDLGVEPGSLGGARVWIVLPTPHSACRAA
jgi:signal transduction histidine kinase